MADIFFKSGNQTFFSRTALSSTINGVQKTRIHPLGHTVTSALAQLQLSALAASAAATAAAAAPAHAAAAGGGAGAALPPPPPPRAVDVAAALPALTSSVAEELLQAFARTCDAQRDLGAEFGTAAAGPSAGGGNAGAAAAPGERVEPPVAAAAAAAAAVAAEGSAGVMGRPRRAAAEKARAGFKTLDKPVAGVDDEVTSQDGMDEERPPHDGMDGDEPYSTEEEDTEEEDSDLDDYELAW